MRTYRVTAQPSAEPVTVAQVKRLLRIAESETYDDDDISDQISAARQWLERKTGHSLITQTVEMVSSLFDDVVGAPVSGVIAGSRLRIELMQGPVQAVSSVQIERATEQWVDLTETTQYVFVPSRGDNPAYIYFSEIDLAEWIGTTGAFGIYPAEWAQGPRVKVTYTAGYGDEGTDVPYNLREAVKRAAAFLYDNRSDPIPDSMLPADFIQWRL